MGVGESGESLVGSLKSGGGKRGVGKSVAS